VQPPAPLVQSAHSQTNVCSLFINFIKWDKPKFFLFKGTANVCRLAMHQQRPLSPQPFLKAVEPPLRLDLSQHLARAALTGPNSNTLVLMRVVPNSATLPGQVLLVSNSKPTENQFPH